MFLKLNDKFIDISAKKKVSFYSSSRIRIITLSTLLSDQYLVLPNFVLFNKEKSTLCLSTNDQVDCSLKIKFEEDVLKWIKSANKLFRSKLVLKGLGCKANLSNNQTQLNLKLGYSHVLNLNIPTERLKVKVCKNVLTVQGYNFSEVGDFARKVRGLRLPDSYKGKGIWFKNEHRVLKELKKK